MTTATRIRIVIGLLAGGWVALMASVHAAPAPERYPARPIRLVNPYAPGGLTDVVSRLLARHTTEAWGQQVIVDSRGGGGTTIGTEIVVRAPSDGYTMLCTTAALAMMQARVQHAQRFDPGGAGVASAGRHRVESQRARA